MQLGPARKKKEEERARKRKKKNNKKLRVPCAATLGEKRGRVSIKLLRRRRNMKHGKHERGHGHQPMAL
jgi:hypothetical protein